jgi:hypothetical protein
MLRALTARSGQVPCVGSVHSAGRAMRRSHEWPLVASALRVRLSCDCFLLCVCVADVVRSVGKARAVGLVVDRAAGTARLVSEGRLSAPVLRGLPPGHLVPFVSVAEQGVQGVRVSRACRCAAGSQTH